MTITRIVRILQSINTPNAHFQSADTFQTHALHQTLYPFALYPPPIADSVPALTLITLHYSLPTTLNKLLN